jgi:hypothetical protein
LVRPAWALSCGCKSRREEVIPIEAKRNCGRATDRGKEAWIYRELVKRGLLPQKAARVAANGRRRWKNSGMTIHIAFPVTYFDGLGLPRLAATSTR